VSARAFLFNGKVKRSAGEYHDPVCRKNPIEPMDFIVKQILVILLPYFILETQ
jgi:hypothetical protein